MRIISKIRFAAVCGMFFIGLNANAEVKPYPVPKQLYYSMHNDDFTVQVRNAGERVWTDLFEYNVVVDSDTKSNASMVQFDFSGKVEVRVKKNNGTLNSVAIRPSSKGINPTVKGNVITFTLDRPEDLSVECDGDHLHNLHIFTNPIDGSHPKKGDKGVMYFDAGWHEPTNEKDKSFDIPSNTVVYMEPGAVLNGKIVCDSVENVKICGRGMLVRPEEGVEITFSKNVTIDGLTVIDPRHYTVYGGQSNGVTVKHLRSFSFQGWSDGVDLMCCSNVLVDSVFMRNSDDGIALYNHRWDFYGGTRDVTVRNSTLWADVAHPVNIGGHGNYENAETMERVHISNIDILDHAEDDPPYEGCIAIDAGDRNLIRDVLCENIRIERIEEGRLFYIRVRFNEKYDHKPGRGIENIVLRNITYNGDNDSQILILGYDKNRKIKNVTFDNVVVNGKVLSDTGDFCINEYVEGVKFSK